MKQQPTNIITALREKTTMFLLDRHLKKNPHKAKIYNLSTAKTAGILYDATSKDNFIIVKELVNELKKSGISCNALGYINKSKRDDNYIGDNTYNFTYKKDFGVLYSVKNESVQKFVDTGFNILIVLVQDYLFTINYLGWLSKAEFKVGRSKFDNDMLDLIIDMEDQKSIKELKNQIMHYLKILNNG